jgi:hypothetical protein
MTFSISRFSGWASPPEHRVASSSSSPTSFNSVLVGNVRQKHRATGAFHSPRSDVKFGSVCNSIATNSWRNVVRNRGVGPWRFGRNPYVGTANGIRAEFDQLRRERTAVRQNASGRPG